MMTLYPALRSSREVCDPMKPRPPVTRMKVSLEFKGETWFRTADTIISESESGVVIEEEKDELSDNVDEDRELERRDIMCSAERM